MKTMVSLPQKISVCCKAVDLRMGQTGLLGVLREATKMNASGEVLYLFCNRNRSIVKGLFWDRTGYIVFSKRLENGKFHIPMSEQTLSINGRSLRMLLDGLKLFL